MAATRRVLCFSAAMSLFIFVSTTSFRIALTYYCLYTLYSCTCGVLLYPPATSICRPYCRPCVSWRGTLCNPLLPVGWRWVDIQGSWCFCCSVANSSNLPYFMLAIVDRIQSRATYCCVYLVNEYCKLCCTLYTGSIYCCTRHVSVSYSSQLGVICVSYVVQQC